MKFEQDIVFTDYCVVCGKWQEKAMETCSKPCKETLQKVRNIIDNQATIEKELGGKKEKWNARAIKSFNDLQDSIK